MVEEDGKRDGDVLIIRKLQTDQRLGFKTVALSVSLTPTDVSKATVPLPPKIEVPPTANMTVLSRLTICLNDDQSNVLYKLLQQPSVKEYDLLSYQPLSDKILNQLCSGSLLCDIICLDMSQRLTVDLKRSNLNLLRTRGVCMEINYTDAFKGQSNRQECISAGQLLVEKTRGRNIILSSGCTSPIQLRSPFDVSNLSLLFGLKEFQAKESVWKTGLLAIKHGLTRRNPNSSCVQVVSGVEKNNTAEPQDKWLIKELSNRQINSDTKTGMKRKGKQPLKEPPEKTTRSE